MIVGVMGIAINAITIILASMTRFLGIGITLSIYFFRKYIYISLKMKSENIFTKLKCDVSAYYSSKASNSHPLDK